jgi:hypothetical protein
MGLEERGYPNLGYASPDTQNAKWVFCMDTLLEAISIMFETHFGFEFPNRSPIGDSLTKVINTN